MLSIQITYCIENAVLNRLQQGLIKILIYSLQEKK